MDYKSKQRRQKAWGDEGSAQCKVGVNDTSDKKKIRMNLLPIPKISVLANTR